MRESSPRFQEPISAPRPHGAWLLTAFSPKLGRTVRAFDHAGFGQWIRLETDPAISTFCEHPRRIGGLHKTNGGQQMHDRLRFCTACMALAYHGVMHQRAGAGRCPCHGVALEEHCRGCGAGVEYRLNAKLLGAPFRCANCRRPYAGWHARLVPQAAPPELRRAITRARCNG